MTYTPSINAKVDSNNSRSVGVLAGDAVFSGTSQNVAGYTSIQVVISSNKSSAPLGLEFLFSPDNTNWYSYLKQTFDMYMSQNAIKINVHGTYFKISYTNGTADTSASFQLTTYLELADINPLAITTYQKKHVDSYGKLKVVNPLTLLDLRFYSTGLNTNPVLSVTESSNATYYTSTIETDTSSVLIAKVTGGGADGHFKSQSRRYAVYQPGKSMLINLTGILKVGTNTDVTTRIGYFDDNNGLFFQHINGVVSVVLRNNTSDTPIPSTSWNIDAMDGTGTSGMTLNVAFEQFYIIEFAWLGVGGIRFGILHHDEVHFCHIISNANTLTAPYMSNPNLPVRYELSGSTNDSEGSMLQGCASVISEGGYNPIGRIFSAGNSTVIAVTNSVEVPLLMLMGNNNYYHHTVIPQSISVLSTTNNDPIIVRVRLYLSGASTGLTPTWINATSTYSVIKHAVAFTGTFAAGTSIVISQENVYSRSNFSINNLANTFTQLSSDVGNVSDIILVTAIGLTATASVVASMTWQEIY